MNVWLLHVGEELPVDENSRLFRYGHLAEALAGRGHQVLRWAPTFQHARKQQRFDQDTRITVRPSYDIQFVHTRGYSRNISLARFRSYQELASRFSTLAAREHRPDIILSGIPSPAWCAAAIKYGKQFNIPVVVDVRDLWPDIFQTAVPPMVRPLTRRLLRPLFTQARNICRDATSLVGVSQSYLQWGLANAGRERGDHDAVIPLGYRTHSFREGELESRTEELIRRGVDPKKTIVCFFGLYEKSYDVAGLLQAAQLLDGRSDIQFVLCGRGSQSKEVDRAAAKFGNLVSLGWVGPATLAAVMQLASIGLASYSADALQSLPNKPFEYMAGRLAVVSSLSGELRELLESHGCGTTYLPGEGINLSECLQQLTEDPARLTRMQDNALAAFNGHFRAETLALRMVDHLEGLANRRDFHQEFAA